MMHSNTETGTAWANTFSIVGRCRRSGEFGIAVATAVPAVATRVPFVNLHGAIATQARVNLALGQKGVHLLELGLPVDRAVSALLGEDENVEERQVHGIDAQGRVFAHTGERCVPWAGHHTGRDYTVAGNMLVGEDILSAMADHFESTCEAMELAERLLECLERGQEAGGDKRGKESAALLVASPQPTFYHNLRVDLHTDPVAELRRMFDVIRDRWDREYRDADLRLQIKW